MRTANVFETPVADDPGSDFLAVVEPFTVFPERWLSLLAGLMTVQRFHEDEMIFHATDLSDAVYVVRKGRVTLFTDTVGEPVQLMSRVNAGEMFGEIGVLEHSRRTVSARAATDTELLRLEASDLNRLGRASRRFGVRLAQSALVRYMKESACKVGLGQSSEVRIRVGRDVVLQSEHLGAAPVVLDNLSLGGACLRSVPEDWEFGGAERMAFALEDETELLQIEARAAWRKGTSLGLAFTAKSADHDTRVDAALGMLLGDHAPARRFRAA